MKGNLEQEAAGLRQDLARQEQVRQGLGWVAGRMARGLGGR